MRKIALVIAVFAMGIGSLAAQKLGHVNAQEIMTLLPERAQVEADAKAYAQTLDSQFQLMGTEYQTKLAEIQQLPPETPEAVRETKITELQGLEQRINEFQVKAQSDMANKEQELLQPLVEKVQNAINKVAESNNFTYIYDNSVLLYAGGTDIGPMVKKELGLAQ